MGPHLMHETDLPNAS